MAAPAFKAMTTGLRKILFLFQKCVGNPEKHINPWENFANYKNGRNVFPDTLLKIKGWIDYIISNLRWEWMYYLYIFNLNKQVHNITGNITL